MKVNPRGLKKIQQKAKSDTALKLPPIFYPVTNTSDKANMEITCSPLSSKLPLYWTASKPSDLTDGLSEGLKQAMQMTTLESDWPKANL